MKLLITGFDPFGNESINPAWEAVKLLPSKIEGVEVTKLQIPTVFNESIDLLLEGIKEHQPDVVICVGQAGGRFDITIERVAINLEDARGVDNKGNQPIDKPVYSDGENAYFTNLPIKAMVEEIKKAKIPASVSNTAGTYVCNHIMYGLLYHINKFSVAKKGGFIHVPFIPEQVLDKRNMPSMDLNSIAKGLEASIKGIYENEVDLKITAGTEC
ncbi:MAG: pyroglutamyl-peptidase I [Fusobacteria bacterium]|nr:MAG: pyroglutamyl-peptidase I [Fusobacteriota bacterium]